MKRIIVSKDGTGDFEKVQDAINFVPDNNKEKIEIFIKSGKYYEKIIVGEKKTNIIFIGEDNKKTFLEYDDYALKKDENGEPLTTYRTPSLTIVANDFRAKNLTICNTAGPGELVGQAVAIQILGDRCIFKDCRFLAYQDTFYTKGENSRIYVKDCYIEGDVDFIFGASIAVFDNCTISSIHKSGFVCAPSTPIKKKYGYLFYKCSLISELEENTVYLGRPWHPAGDPDAIASVVFNECNLGKHIRKEGWTEMKGFKAEDARMYEYRNKGEGAKEDKMRRQLTTEEQKEYTMEKMLIGTDNWEFKADF